MSIYKEKDNCFLKDMQPWNAIVNMCVVINLKYKVLFDTF